MTLRKAALTEKIFVLGVDGLDPRYSRKMLREGKMPNLQKFIDRGSCREDLMLLGGHPTVTPPMWTTLSTGAYANVHGITGFNRQGSDIDRIIPNFDSRNCTAEPIWNALAEAGIKTGVFHWPGNSWPPTSDSENLFVCDGTTPGGLGLGAPSLSEEYMMIADASVADFISERSATADMDKACVVNEEDARKMIESADQVNNNNPYAGERVKMVVDYHDGVNSVNIPEQLSTVTSPISEPKNWGFEIPADALEFTLLLSKGAIHRPALILKNENGVYDSVAIYKNKKTAAPIVVLENGIIKSQIYDKAYSQDQMKDASYNMKLLNIKEDGSYLEIYISKGMDMHADYIFSPKSMFYEITEHCGHIPPSCYVGNNDPKMITDCMLDNWNVVIDWQSRVLHYMMNEMGMQAIFSHMHNVDMQEHRFIRFMSKSDKMYQEDYEAKDPEMYIKFMDDVYEQTDRYIGTFLHLLDEDWTVLIVSDHAQVCAAHRPVMLGETRGVNVGVMKELGYTEILQNPDGSYAVDWSKTTAVACRECNIYINLKGRNKHTLPDGTVVDGLVDPKDKYEFEEQLMTDLYGYRDKKSGKRVVQLAVRNKDAVLLGYGGPECGDICYWMADDYNSDHSMGLSTVEGDCETSLSPIFVAAGKGIKKGYKTERIIRQVDVVPTVAILMNCRMPAQCEGAPAYQIFDQEF